MQIFCTKDGLIDAMRRLVRDFINEEKLRIGVVFVTDTCSHPLPRNTEQLWEVPMQDIAIIIPKVILQKHLCDVELGLLHARLP